MTIGFAKDRGGLPNGRGLSGSEANASLEQKARRNSGSYQVKHIICYHWREPGSLCAEIGSYGPLAELQKLYFDFPLSARPETLAPLMELVSIKTVLFGSDFPFANRGASLEENLEGRGNVELLLPNFAPSGQ